MENLLPRFADSEFECVEPHNIKWFSSLIILTVSCFFCLIFSSSLNLQQNWCTYEKAIGIFCAFSLGRGGNDSQKVMGIIAAAVAVYINANPGIQMDSG
jgi:PiT family inorganic phosphate transporter